MSLHWLNELSDMLATQELVACCSCERWARELASARPFASADALYKVADSIWATASEEERLEAFSGHPQIGDMAALGSKYGNRYAATANREQGQIVTADDSVLAALLDDNRQYLERNGFIFIVCATRKSASEMLGLLRDRMHNDRLTELDNAAREQGEIMRLRLQQLIEVNN